MLQEIPIEELSLSMNESQCLRRDTFDPVWLDELAESIKTHGVLQPIVVRDFVDRKRMDKPNKLIIVAGERRYLAALKAGLKTIPALVRPMSDEEVIQVQLIENLQRQDLDPLHEAEGYQELVRYGHPVDEINAQVGKSRAYVYKRMQLLQLTKKAKAALIKGDITVGIAQLLARIQNEKLQNEALDTFTCMLPEDRPTLVGARQIIESDYMLSLKNAPFPTDDPDLVRSAPACARCPKRTGNQAELFDDIKSTDVCTDPECFKAKKVNHSKRKLKEWEAQGREVIKGKRAQEVAPFGRYGNFHMLKGYKQLDDSTVITTDSGRCVTKKISTLVKDELDKTALLQAPNGDVIEVIPSTIVNKAVRAIEKTAKKGNAKAQDPQKSLERKAAEENKFRLAFYQRIRSELSQDDGSLLPEVVPTRADLALMVVRSLWHDHRKLLCKLYELEPLKAKNLYGKDYDGPLEKKIKSADPAELDLIMIDATVINELKVSTFDRVVMRNINQLAKKVGVTPKQVRAELKAKDNAIAKAKKAVKKVQAAAKKAGAPKKKRKAAKKPRKKDLDPFVHGSSGAQ